jgi:cytidylate kinase
MERIITIDGPAGGGKSTVSRLLAGRLGFIYLDTGAMYRAVALQARKEGVEPEDARGLEGLCRNLDLHFESGGGSPRLFIGEEDVSLAIRSPEMDMLSSRISVVREVREAMTELQRRIASSGGVVAEGRDMGTVVFPNAGHKFFITASLEVRAERRYRERVGRGESMSRDDVEKEIKRRDEQDSGRAIAPLVPAKDATIIDTTGLDPEQVVDIMLSGIRE